MLGSHHLLNKESQVPDQQVQRGLSMFSCLQITICYLYAICTIQYSPSLSLLLPLPYHKSPEAV
jgi:hypothetical protein